MLTVKDIWPLASLSRTSISHKFSLDVAFDVSSFCHGPHTDYILLPSSSYLIDVDFIISHRFLAGNMRSDSIGIGGLFFHRHFADMCLQALAQNL
jgi:hypothetical protein